MEGREGAKYRANAKPSHIHTRPPKPYQPKAPFPKGRLRPVCPPAPRRTPPGITLPQLQRQRDGGRVIQEGGNGARAGQGTGHGIAEQGAGGDKGSAQGRSQGTGQGAHGKESGQGHWQGTKASGSGLQDVTGTGKWRWSQMHCACRICDYLDFMFSICAVIDCCCIFVCIYHY